MRTRSCLLPIDVDRLDQDRVRKGWTIEDLARQCLPVANRSQVSRLISGSNKSLPLLIMVAAALGHSHTRYLRRTTGKRVK